MNSSTRKHFNRWSLIGLIAFLIILVVGGALYAQGQNRRTQPRMGQGMQQGPGDGSGPGMMGRGQGPGQVPGMQGPGYGMGHGPEAIFGMQFLMQDEEIRELGGLIMTVHQINKFEMTSSQVSQWIVLAREAQDIMDEEFSDAREMVKTQLENQLDAALRGEEPDPGHMRELMGEIREQHDPGEVRDQLHGILDEALEVLTEDQMDQLCSQMGPGADQIRERAQDWAGPGQHGGEHGQMGREWFRNLDDEEREELREQFGAHLDQMNEGRARMKVMMVLLSPQAVDGMELWLDYNR